MMDRIVDGTIGLIAVGMLATWPHVVRYADKLRRHDIDEENNP